MKTLRAIVYSDSRQTLAQIFISSRTGKEWMAQRAQIKSGASHQHSHMTPRFNLTNRPQRYFDSQRALSRRRWPNNRNDVAQIVKLRFVLWHRRFATDAN